MDLHALQPGYMLSEYRIEKLLGEGGFGLTYLAFDTHLEKLVAIKEYMPSDYAVRQESVTILPKNDQAREMYEWGLEAFINEAKILARFDAPNIVKIYRFFGANNTAYFVMEYCEGGTLIDLVATPKTQESEKTKAVMRESRVRNIIGPIITGLQEVHDSEVLHRDIKPHNIMFRKDGTPVLIDFGAARQALGEKSRSLTTILTPGYAPLEQYSSNGNVGPWTDIYALAAVAYICLTGKRPDDATDRITVDKIVKLANRDKTSGFLHSMDWGLAVQAVDRPLTLAAWQAAWDKPMEPESVASPEQAPFKQAPQFQAATPLAVPLPVQLPPSSGPSFPPPSAKQGVKKWMVAIPLILTALSVSGYWFYTDYFKKPAVDTIPKSTTTSTVEGSESNRQRDQDKDDKFKRVGSSTLKKVILPPNEEKPVTIKLNDRSEVLDQSTELESDDLIANVSYSEPLELPEPKVTRRLPPIVQFEPTKPKKLFTTIIRPVKKRENSQVKLSSIDLVEVLGLDSEGGFEESYFNDMAITAMINQRIAGREWLTITELQTLAKDITQYLRHQKGYLLATAYVPKQRVKDGVVKMAVLKGKLESTVVEGYSGHESASLHTAFNGMKGRVIKASHVKEKLLELQMSLDVYITGSFSSGNELGYATLTIVVNEDNMEINEDEAIHVSAPGIKLPLDQQPTGEGY